MWGVGSSDAADALTDLVAWWPCNEESGTRADAHGSLTLTDNNTVQYGTGKQGNSAFTNPVNLEYLSNSSAGVLQPSGDFSVGFWFKPQGFSSQYSRLMTFIKDDTADSVFTVAIQESDHGTYPNHIMFETYTNGAGDTPRATVYSSSPAVLYSWMWICCHYDVTGQQIGISINNGTPVTAACTFTLQTGGTHFFLNSTADPALYADGYYDEVAIWHAQLPAATRNWVYNSGLGRAYPG
jgi:hypothetical protein